MTKFDVGWHDAAIDQLAELYLSAVDKWAITEADRIINAELARNAHLKGKPADRQTREAWKSAIPQTWDLRTFTDAPPLRVLYTVSEPDRKAYVLMIYPVDDLPLQE